MHIVSPFLVDRNIRPSDLDSLLRSTLVKFATVSHVDLLTSGAEVNSENESHFFLKVYRQQHCCQWLGYVLLPGEGDEKRWKHNEGMSALKRKKAAKARGKSLHPTFSNYARTSFRHETLSSQQNIHVPSGAWFRHFL
jgi:hypothetical protein